MEVYAPPYGKNNSIPVRGQGPGKIMGPKIFFSFFLNEDNEDNEDIIYLYTIFTQITLVQSTIYRVIP